LVAEILQKSGEMSYAKAAAGTTISKQTVHNRLMALKEVVKPVEKVREPPEILDVFADEDHVHLTPKGNAIVPLVTITEGMDESNTKRHKTINPFHMAEYGMKTSAFSENVLAVLTERYDLDQVEEIRLHGDGGRWIEGLGSVLPKCKPVMDGYHIEKRIRAFLRLPGASGYARVLRKAIEEGDLKKFQDYCIAICDRQEDKKNREHANEFVYHCTNHWDAITRRKGGQVCGSCTEAQVSHVLSERLSRAPLGWSEQGLRQMTMLRVYIKNGGKLTKEDVRVSIPKETDFTAYQEDGYALYRQYAEKQSSDYLSQHDWSVFEKESFSLSKLDFPYLLLKSLGAPQNVTV